MRRWLQVGAVLLIGLAALAARVEMGRDRAAAAVEAALDDASCAARGGNWEAAHSSAREAVRRAPSNETALFLYDVVRRVVTTGESGGPPDEERRITLLQRGQLDPLSELVATDERSRPRSERWHRLVSELQARGTDGCP